MSDYDWRGGHGSPSYNPTLDWETTFGQRKAHLAKEWEDSTEYRRKQLIEIVLFYSAIHEEQEL